MESFREKFRLNQYISGKILYFLAIRKAHWKNSGKCPEASALGIISIFLGDFRPYAACAGDILSGNILYPGIWYPENYVLLCLWCSVIQTGIHYIILISEIFARDQNNLLNISGPDLMDFHTNQKSQGSSLIHFQDHVEGRVARV